MYLRAPEYFGINSNELLELFKLLYGISHSDNYWNHELKGHIHKVIQLTQATGDLWLWFKTINDSLHSAIYVYVDEQIETGSKILEARVTEQKYQYIPRKYEKLVFKGVEI